MSTRCHQTHIRTLRTLWIMVGVLLSSGVSGQPEPVDNRDPLLPLRTLTLQEVWRTGGEDSEQLLGMLIDSGTDDAGNVYLLDNQLCQVKVFSPDGSHLRTLSRRGEGPGEVTGPVAMVFLPGEILGLLEIIPAKLETITLNGDPAGRLVFGGDQDAQTGFNFAVDCKYRAGVLLQAGMISSPTAEGQKRVQFLAQFSETGAEMVRYCESEANLTFNPPRFVENEVLPPFWFGNTVGPDGRVYVASSRDEYRIEVFSAEGQLVQVIKRDFENWKRDKRDRRRMEAMVEAWYSEVPTKIESSFDAHEPTISELFVDDSGILWVQHSRSGRNQPDGILMTYDTFDQKGRYLQRVSIAAEGDPAYDGLRHLGDGRVLLIKGYVLSRWARLSPGGLVDFGEDEAGPIEVIYCRVVE